jgi:hypothetical protein
VTGSSAYRSTADVPSRSSWNRKAVASNSSAGTVYLALVAVASLSIAVAGGFVG